MYDPNRGGRPLKFKTPEDLERKCEEYLESCFEDKPVMGKDGWPIKDENGCAVMERTQITPITVSGLAVALDTDRITLLRYEKDEVISVNEEQRKRFSNTVKKYKAICERFAEEQLYKLRNPAGAIFSLKNNWQWVDKTEFTVNDTPDKLNPDDVSKRVREKLKLENKNKK